MKLRISQMKKATALLALLAIIPITGWASSSSNGQGGQGGGRPNGPPPEAIEACEGKSEGDSVSFETPRGDTVTGTCKEKDGQMVAMPEGGGRGPRD